MGLVYQQSALLHQRLVKQSAATKRKYNSSSVNQAGYTRDQIKKRVRESDKFTASEKAFLAYVADQDPDKFVFCVTTVRAALGFGELRWATLKQKLVAKGFLRQQSVALSSKARHWFLDLDFEPLRNAKYDAPPREKKIGHLYNARAHVIPDFQGVNSLRHTPPAPLQGGRAECVDESGNRSLGVAKAAQAQAGQQTRPMPTPPAIPPAPKGGGAVLHARSTNKNHSKDKSMKFNFAYAQDFFDFLGRHGILSVKLAAQRRKKSDGKRGAPMGFGASGKNGKWNPVAVASPARTAAAAGLAQALLAHLAEKGKNKLELITAAAEDSQGLSKSILLDDLKEVGAKILKTKWRGPGAVLETSPDNFQAVLILSEPMDRDSRRSITAQLVDMVGADPGAAGVGQFHRLPGSVNYKAELAEPFVCRLVEYFTGVGEGVQPVKAVAKPMSTPVSPVRPSALQPLRKRRWQTPAKSMSDEAFRLAVDMIDSGARADQVEAALSSPEWLRHHSAADWPERTRRSAELFIEGRLYGHKGSDHA